MDKLGNTGWEKIIHQRAFDGFRGDLTIPQQQKNKAQQGRANSKTIQVCSDREAELCA